MQICPAFKHPLTHGKSAKKSPLCASGSTGATYQAALHSTQPLQFQWEALDDQIGQDIRKLHLVKLPVGVHQEFCKRQNLRNLFGTTAI